jgi:hypothetical protein
MGSLGKSKSTDNDVRLLVELLEQILLNGTNENRAYCKYCKAKMIMPIELHRDDCLWRHA